mgnify:CR=1 FL=1
MIRCSNYFRRAFSGGQIVWRARLFLYLGHFDLNITTNIEMIYTFWCFEICSQTRVYPSSEGHMIQFFHPRFGLDLFQILNFRIEVTSNHYVCFK